VRSADNFDWTDEAKATLTRLWAEGHRTAAIGEKMGISKRAVISKAARMKLPARANPCKHRGLCELASAPTLRRRRAALETQKTIVLPVILVRRKNEPCCFVTETGIDVAGKRWRYCDAPCAHGSYCAEHSGQMYAPKSNTQEVST